MFLVRLPETCMKKGRKERLEVRQPALVPFQESGREMRFDTYNSHDSATD